jgi:hypothetical protein
MEMPRALEEHGVRSPLAFLSQALQDRPMTMGQQRQQLVHMAPVGGRLLWPHTGPGALAELKGLTRLR